MTGVQFGMDDREADDRFILKAPANEDTLLPTQTFARLPVRATVIADTNFVSGTQKMFLNKACEYIRDKLDNDNTLHLSTLMTSFLYWSLPFQIIILCIITVYTSKFMAALWAVQLALSSPTSAWK